MKLYAYKVGDGVLLAVGKHAAGNFLGTIEVEEPKRTVVKEAHCIGIKGNIPNDTRTDARDEFTFTLPSRGRNVKCTYEIEE